MKTLKEILQVEVYEPKSPDEKRFKDKHVVVKHKDANGNDDNLFNAKNIKTVNRTPEHGYNPGEDEKVYESYYDDPAVRKYLDHADKYRTGKDTPHAHMFKKKELSKKDVGEITGNHQYVSSETTNKLNDLHKKFRKNYVEEEVEELDERQMNVYAIATAHVKKKYGLKGKNVDLTKEQTVESHKLAKKIAKKMGVPLKESLDEQSLKAIQQAYKTIMGKKGPGTVAKREELKAAAKEAAASSKKPKELTTTQRMADILNGKVDVNKISAPKYPEKMLGPEDEGPDKRYGSGPQKGGIYKDKTKGGFFAAEWPDGVEPKTPRKKSTTKSKK